MDRDFCAFAKIIEPAELIVDKGLQRAHIDETEPLSLFFLPDQERNQGKKRRLRFSSGGCCRNDNVTFVLISNGMARY
jgi:hypothetical protein